MNWINGTYFMMNTTYELSMKKKKQKVGEDDETSNSSVYIATQFKRFRRPGRNGFSYCHHPQGAQGQPQGARQIWENS